MAVNRQTMTALDDMRSPIARSIFTPTTLRHDTTWRRRVAGNISAVLSPATLLSQSVGESNKLDLCWLHHDACCMYRKKPRFLYWLLIMSLLYTMVLILCMPRRPRERGTIGASGERLFLMNSLQPAYRMTTETGKLQRVRAPASAQKGSAVHQLVVICLLTELLQASKLGVFVPNFSATVIKCGKQDKT